MRFHFFDARAAMAFASAVASGGVEAAPAGTAAFRGQPGDGAEPNAIHSEPPVSFKRPKSQPSLHPLLRMPEGRRRSERLQVVDQGLSVVFRQVGVAVIVPLVGVAVYERTIGIAGLERRRLVPNSSLRRRFEPDVDRVELTRSDPGTRAFGSDGGSRQFERGGNRPIVKIGCRRPDAVQGTAGIAEVCRALSSCSAAAAPCFSGVRAGGWCDRGLQNDIGLGRTRDMEKLRKSFLRDVHLLAE